MAIPSVPIKTYTNVDSYIKFKLVFGIYWLILYASSYALKYLCILFATYSQGRFAFYDK